MYVIAEIGNNHEGDSGTALDLVAAACEADADAVKMQHFRAETLVNATMAPPEHARTHKTMRERLASMELPWETYERARDICDKYKRDLVITPLDVDSFQQCAELADKVKISSGDITYMPILNAAAKCGKPVIMSTGMADCDEIYNAFTIVRPESMLHCVSRYPTIPIQANMSRIMTLMDHYRDVEVGYSDHCVGMQACLIAAAMGATVIEKHFTLNRCRIKNAGNAGDHVHSLDEFEMSAMVEALEEIPVYLGLRRLVVVRPADIEMRQYLRRGPNGLRGSYTEDLPCAS